MYHTYVRRQIRRAYGLINTGQLDALVSQFAPDAVFAFPGEHVLGGEFRGPDAVRAWFTEVRRLFPDFRLEDTKVVIDALDRFRELGMDPGATLH